MKQLVVGKFYLDESGCASKYEPWIKQDWLRPSSILLIDEF
jgi:hypothetical protein